MSASCKLSKPKQVSGRSCGAVVFGALMRRANLLLSNQFSLRAIILLRGRKAEKVPGSISLEVILQIWRDALYFSSCFILMGKYMNMAFPWTEGKCMKNGCCNLLKKILHRCLHALPIKMARPDIEPRFANYQAKDRQLADVLKNSIQEAQKNQLFLYKLYDNGIKQAEQIVHWFKNLQVIFPHTKVQALPLHMKADEELRQYIATMLHKMDTGVYEITVASEEIDFREYAEKLNLPKEIIDDIEEIKNGIVNLWGKYFVFAENKKQRTILLQLKFNHRLTIDSQKSPPSVRWR